MLRFTVSEREAITPAAPQVVQAAFRTEADAFSYFVSTYKDALGYVAEIRDGSLVLAVTDSEGHIINRD